MTADPKITDADREKAMALCPNGHGHPTRSMGVCDTCRRIALALAEEREKAARIVQTHGDLREGSGSEFYDLATAIREGKA